MKKISLFLGVLLVLLIALPFLLKDQLITKEFAKVHENEGVFVSYQNSSLNLFSFPSIAISLTDVVVKNEKFSQQPQLAKCEKLSVQISLSELFSEDPVIKSVILQKGTADLFICLLYTSPSPRD